MPKTESEILEAHRTTIEALTGKRCNIKLISKEDELLKAMHLDQIRVGVETVFDCSIFSKKRKRELVLSRRSFCLFASLKHSQNEISDYLNFSYDAIRHCLRNGRYQLKNDPEFIEQHTQVKKILLGGS